MDDFMIHISRPHSRSKRPTNPSCEIFSVTVEDGRKQ
jgi:hypothetical protein